MAQNNNPPWDRFFGPSVLDWSSDLRLDIVGFLAILGEASVQSNAQVQALSYFSFLPRLIPAPQALIRTSRPERLAPARDGRVVSSHSGNSKDCINRVASILHAGAVEPYSVSVVKITENNPIKKNEIKKGEIYQGRQAVVAKALGPLTGLSLLGTAMSIILIVASCTIPHQNGDQHGDGMSLLATICISLLSCLIGIGSKWKLILPTRRASRDVPDSDAIIVYPQGSFLIVRCSEEVHRQLYWHTEKCEYYVKSETVYRFIALTCTVLLMAGVIFLGNASTEMQLAWVGAYVLLHAAYWTVAALPARVHWDLGGFDKKTIEIEDPIKYENPTYTQALWQAIAITGTSKWARDFGVANKSDGWDKWLHEANMAAQAGCGNDVIKEAGKPDRLKLTLPKWNAQEILDEILKEEITSHGQRRSQQSSLRRAEAGEHGINGHHLDLPKG